VKCPLQVEIARSQPNSHAILILLTMRKFPISRCALLLIALLGVFVSDMLAQSDPKAGDEAEPTQTKTPDTFFEHSDTAKWWISGQANFVFQAHGDFYALYSGPNSLKNTAENAISRVLTLYTGYEITPTTAVYLDVEEAGWGGISGALGLAGFTNLDVVRNPSIGTAPYIARLMLQQIIPLSKEKITQERSALELQTELPARRLEIRVGKFSTADFFDYNIGGTDSHYQFLNWVIDNNGAYDYAADTRGYTMGVILDYEDRNWGLRFGELLMPKVANGPQLSWDIANSRAENIELELRPTLLKDRDTKVRFLSYVNHADMGDYRDSLLLYKEGLTSTPEITATREPGRIKYGFGINFEQEFAKDMYAFGRWGWNDGKTESFAYTEDESGVEIGTYFVGTRWKRSLDRAGVAFVSSGIKSYHQQYLAEGGLGFILGDGGLTYGRENIEEMFYTVHAWRGLFFAVDLQHVNNPGYNQVRGPVTVPGVRMHLEF
jgi:high affinity Mn2+ porin